MIPAPHLQPQSKLAEFWLSCEREKDCQTCGRKRQNHWPNGWVCTDLVAPWRYDTSQTRLSLHPHLQSRRPRKKNRTRLDQQEKRAASRNIGPWMASMACHSP